MDARVINAVGRGIAFCIFIVLGVARASDEGGGYREGGEQEEGEGFTHLGLQRESRGILRAAGTDRERSLKERALKSVHGAAVHVAREPSRAGAAPYNVVT